MKKTFKTVLALILVPVFVFSCISGMLIVQAGAASKPVFSLNVVSETKTGAEISVNLESGSFHNGTFTLTFGKDITACTKIVKSEKFRAFCEEQEELSQLITFVANPVEKMFTLASTVDITEPGAIVIITVTKAENKIILPSLVSLKVDDIDAEVVNKIPAGENGKCGDKLNWSLDYATGALNITGTGAMYNYESGKSPFYNKDRIKTVKFENGATTIGNYAFQACENIVSITISESIKTYGDYAFSGCKNLSAVSAYSKVETYGKNVFDGCAKIRSLTMQLDVKKIGAAVIDNSSITDIYYKGTKFDWNKIVIDANNTKLKAANIHYTGVALGDINDDGYINSNDALIVLEDIVKAKTMTTEQRKYADTNKDGLINSNDALQILLFAVGKINKF